MSLKMQGFVEFQPVAFTQNGAPVYGDDSQSRFVPAHDRSDYRPLECTHVRPKRMVHVEVVEYELEDGSTETVEHRTPYVELRPVSRTRTRLMPRGKYHHAFPNDERPPLTFVSDVHGTVRVLPQALRSSGRVVRRSSLSEAA